MFDYIRECFDNPVVRYSAVGVALLVTAFVFLGLTINDENTICRDEGFGDYDEKASICTIKEDKEYPEVLIAIAGNTANSPVPGYIIPESLKNADDVLKEIVGVLASGGTVKVVSAATGNEVKTITMKENTDMTASGYIKQLKSAIAEVNQAMSQVPSTNGATYLEGISKAGREAVSQPSKETKIIVVGSGLSDGGLLNFADNDLLHKSAADVLSSLKRNSELAKDMKNIKITWYGIGQTIAPQAILSDAEIQTEKDIYKQVLNERGASVEYIDTMRSNEGIENNAHTVKPTKVRIEIPEEDLYFIENTATFKDEQGAKTTLTNKVLENTKHNPSATITITGYMASGNCDSRNPNNSNLAISRANAVENLLRSMGVQNQIEVIDGKVFDPDQSECDKEGIWQPQLAAPKRKVRIEIQ